jgi:extracellular factor (EF) 3-hydroxypalmitic acid methyl ester biosynthesis protein
MSSAIDRFFSDDLANFASQLTELERRIDPDSDPTDEGILAEIAECIDNSLAACRKLEDELGGEDPIVLKEVQSRYRDAISPLLSKSWVWHRSTAKPRGYPGDYQLLTAIYDAVPKSKGFGGYVDRYLLNFTLSHAVVARMWAAREFLVEELERRQGDVAILNVASGACREYLDGFKRHADRQVKLTCVDNDSEALEFAQGKTAEALAASGIEGKFTRYNALRMTSAAGNIRNFGKSDIIYSIGLCDYIPDEYLIPLLQGLGESLADGGVVYVAFKDALRYDKAEYQWLMDWYFFQRTEEEFRQLFEKAGYDLSQIETTRDRTGVILNYICRTGNAASVRIDGAQQVPLAQHGSLPAAEQVATPPHS